MKGILIFARIIAGALFIFSGFVKAVDPLGSAYKFQDYFQAFGLEFLKFLSLPLAILLCTAEFLAGVSVLSGIRFRAGVTVMMLLMLIFTPLTLLLALTNPVSDCGCFGDAVHLTNWETFGKNVILILLAGLLFVRRKEVHNLFSTAREWSITAITAIIFVLFSAYNLRYLPVIDFLPYKEGTRIADQMVIPEGAQSDVYNTTFIYEKDGLRKEFTVENYPAGDSTWIFVDQKSVLVKKGYVPPIHDFSITCSGEDITDSILTDDRPVLLMITKKLSEADRDKLEQGFLLGRNCLNKGMRFHVVTASGSDETAGYPDAPGICSADETTLKTMLRSNPGYMLIKSGVIIRKWSWANMPEPEKIDDLLNNIQ